MKNNEDFESRFVFLYDELMTKEKQKMLKLDLKFISLAQMQGKMFWYKTAKKIRYQEERVFVIPKNTTKLVFGGLFYMPMWNENKTKILAYFNNSSQTYGSTIKEDIYDVYETTVRPIKLKKLSDLTKSKYKVGKPVEVTTFVGNLQNNRIRFNVERPFYYGLRRIDKNNFIKMIQEQNEKETL